jgi:RNA polymerase sigma-70 factor (ECF subfamily)
MDDAILIKGLQQKDKKAFNALFTRLFPKVLYYAENLTKDKFEGEDIAMNSFAKLWEQSDRFNSIGEVQAYVFTIARNASFNYLRKIKAQHNYETHLANQPKETEEESLSEKLRFEVEMLEKLRQEIEKLPEACREVFKLTYINRMPRAEVAQKLNISLGTVHVHCSNALNRLRQRFSESELILLLVLLELCKN